MSHESTKRYVCACDATPTKCPCPCFGCAVARLEALDAKLARTMGLWWKVPRALLGLYFYLRART